MITVNKRVVITIMTVLLFVFISYHLFTNTNIEMFQDLETTPVYCLMITGHDVRRRSFALNSVENFKNQSYANKHLIILNQDIKFKILKKQTYDNILEVMVDNQGKTLGELRNMSLQFVPPNAVWTTWDDDDWRSPEYLKTMMSAMEEHKVQFLMLSNRIEYNLNTDFMYQLSLKSGLMTFFAKANPNLVYDEVNTSEDKVVKEYALKHLTDQVVVINNDPLLYVRAIHDNNTSVYAKPLKSTIKDTRENKTYFETHVPSKKQTYLRNILSSYYKVKNVVI